MLVALSTFLTGWKNCSDSSILLWPFQCGEDTPPGRGHHQSNHAGTIQTSWLMPGFQTFSIYFMLQNFNSKISDRANDKTCKIPERTAQQFSAIQYNGYMQMLVHSKESFYIPASIHGF